MATVFEVWGKLACFRKPYTTTSTVSFPLPPPTAVAGLISAILGFSNGSAKRGEAALYWQKLKGTRITIQRLNHTSWASSGVNFINPKNPQKNLHIQIRHQFVRNPYYRIFVQGGIEAALDEQLRHKRSVYTPYLGVGYALAEVSYCGSFDFEQALVKNTAEEIPVSSVLPLSSDEEEVQINFKASRGMLKDEFPFQMDETRTLLRTITLLYLSHRSML
jgi:CRISPR-associated protein Cas5h